MSFSLLVAMTLAGDRLFSLSGPEGRACTADARWCVALDERAGEGGERLIVPVVSAGDVAAPAAEPPPEDEYANETYAVWPSLILLKEGGFLAGVKANVRTGYSGGGGSATELRLFRVGSDGRSAAMPVLSVPIAAWLMIRACSSEQDMKDRRGACHDEYDFAGTIGLAGEGADGLPTLTYTTKAEAFPRGVSREGDSMTMPPLKKSDLVHERDPACSFTRRFRFDVVSGGYQPDSPLPDCSAYTTL